MKTYVTLCVSLFAVSACGGGSGGSTTTPPVSAAQPVLPAMTPALVAVPPPVVVTPTPAAVPPAIAGCAEPQANQPVVLWGQTPMKVICNQVYVEPSLTAGEVSYQQQSIAYANDKIAGLYGSFTAANTDVILCKTSDCRAYFSGTGPAGFMGAGNRMTDATYISARESVILTFSSYPESGRPTVTHELAHAELNNRTRGGVGVPAWFNEGQAELIAQSVDCSKVTGKAAQDIRQLDNGTEWYRVTTDSSQAPKAYCQAKREVTAWVEKNGKAKFLALLESIRTRVPFDNVYGPALTN